MKRSSGLRRSTPLRSNPDTTIGWQRRSRKQLPPKSAKARAAKPAEVAIKAEVAARDGGCVARSAAFLGPVCAGPVHYHHLHKASAGGKVTIDGGVSLCNAHNGWVEDDPLVARAVGLVVRWDITPGEAWDRRVAAGLVVRTDRPEL